VRKLQNYASSTKCRTLTLCMDISYGAGNARSCSLLCQCVASILWVLILFSCGCVKCSILYLLLLLLHITRARACARARVMWTGLKGDGLLLAVFACYSWEMALNIGLGASFDNIIIGKTSHLRRFWQTASGFHFFGFHDNFFYIVRSSAFCPTPNLEEQVSVFMSPSDRVAQLYPQAPGSLFVALYDSPIYDGGILTRLHTENRSITCRTGNGCERMQGKLTVRKLM
jgi:hypothetical protein